jgi:hypothetical protein
MPLVAEAFCRTPPLWLIVSRNSLREDCHYAGTSWNASARDSGPSADRVATPNAEEGASRTECGCSSLSKEIGLDKGVFAMDASPAACSLSLSRLSLRRNSAMDRDRASPILVRHITAKLAASGTSFLSKIKERVGNQVTRAIPVPRASTGVVRER